MDASTLAEDFYRYTGLLGVGFYVASYAALQFGLIRGSSPIYTLMNLAAASLVLVSLFVDFNLSSAMIQIMWIVISIVGLTRLAVISSTTRFNEEEAQLWQSKLAGLTRAEVRDFMTSGTWVDRKKGDQLTQQGEVVGALYYLSKGTGQVSVDGAEIATCEPGSFVGDQTCLDGAPATATVTLAEDARLYEIKSAKVIAMCDRNVEFRMVLERALRAEASRRLAQTNIRLAKVS